MGLLWIGKEDRSSPSASSLLGEPALMLTPTLSAIAATHSAAKIDGLGNKLGRAMAAATAKQNAQFRRVFFRDWIAPASSSCINHRRSASLVEMHCHERRHEELWTLCESSDQRFSLIQNQRIPNKRTDKQFLAQRNWTDGSFIQT